MILKVFLLIPCFFYGHLLFGQADTVSSKKEQQQKKWFENFSIRGYTQVRYNRLLETNAALNCDQCDKSWGEGGGFFIRRIRVIFSGQISRQVYFYLQPDFASSASSSNLHFGQIRDAYFDVGVDKKNEFRFRIGQSKIPFGFENLQSSQNRLPLDRNDGLNSAAPNERDLGVFFYWAPEHIRERFAMLVREGYKGSGDYGVFGFGVHNGQGANKPEVNNQPHVVTRITYPFLAGNQIIEPSLQAYTGKYRLSAESLSGRVKVKPGMQYIDQRVAATVVLYPKPFGIQAEYNVGRGPEFNKRTDSIELQPLNGGYMTMSFMKEVNGQLFYPFARAHYYDGGKKFERDARSYRVKELEIGIEWLPVRNFELVAMYTISSRRFEDFSLKNNLQQGRLLRLQAQLNF